jgi:peptidoglycan glycosyltransferase
LALLQELRARTALGDAYSLLVEGNTTEAAARLEAIPISWTVASSQHIANAALATLLNHPDPVEKADLGNRDIPLGLIARTAFNRGDPAATLRLTNLASELGFPTNTTLTAAALIELDRTAEARALSLPHPAALGHLAQRVHHHLGHPRAPEGMLLRDRTGRSIATLDSEGLHFFEETDPELVPPMVALLAQSYPNTGSLRLAIDLELSEAARHAFGPRDRGSIVLLDPQSGEVLAAVSDTITLREGGTPAFEQLREPASIAKLITISAGLRAGLDPDAEIARMTCRGHEVYGGTRLYCPSISGRLRTLDRALAVSCNVAFANLGMMVGRSLLIEELRRFGFDRPNGAFRGGRILSPQGDARQLADLAIGLDDLELTPLHAAQLAAVMVNRGRMPTPVLVSATDGLLGFHPRPLPRVAGIPVLDERWLPVLLSAMEAVATRGTGRKLAPRNFPVAMKTGTASHPRYGFHVNYIGVGPMPHPRLAFCVRITHQRTSRRVRNAARRVTRDLLKSLGEISQARD